MESQLLEQLDIALHMKSKYIDSDYYQGFVQRYDRLYFIKLLSNTIREKHPEMASQVDAMLPSDKRNRVKRSLETFTSDVSKAVKLSNVAPMETVIDSSLKTVVETRRDQFKYRLAKLHEEIENTKYNIQWDKNSRRDMMSLLNAAESRMHEKQGEFERAKSFTGPEMDSSILHGKMQRFSTAALMEELEEELDIEKYYIAETKDELIQVEGFLKSDEKKLEDKKLELQERQKAMEEFEMASSRQAKGLAAFARFQNAGLYRTFLAWIAFVKRRHHDRTVLKNVLFRLESRVIRTGFLTWKVANNFGRGGTSSALGRGSIKLNATGDMRRSLEQECHELLRQLRITSTELTRSNQTAVQITQASKNLIVQEENARGFLKRTKYQSWRQGDACMAAHNYDGAKKAYEAQLKLSVQLQDEDMTQDQGRLHAALGHVALASSHVDEALIRYGRASLLAGSIADRIGSAEAHEGLGKVHAHWRSTRQSLEAFDKGLMAYEDCNDSAGQLRCLRGLQRGYAVSEETSAEERCKAQGDTIEFEMKHKIAYVTTNLDAMRKVLMSVSAQAKTVLVLERVGAIVPRLRAERLLKKRQQMELRHQSKSLNALLQDKETLWELGGTDLAKAVSGDSGYVDSTVLTGVLTRYEVDDFTESLAKLMHMLQLAKEGIATETEEANMEVSNLEEEISEIEKELASETGPLMRRVLSKTTFRIARFNVSNDRLGNVLGESAGGSSHVMTTVGDSVFLFDLTTGVLLSNIVGESKAPTRNFEERRGHRKMIACSFYTSNRLYTGGMDAAVGVYRIEAGGTKCSVVNFIEDLDAAVMSVTANNEYILSGCADCKIVIHDANTFKKVYVVGAAHERTVTFLQMQHGNVASGGADGKVQLWTLTVTGESTPPVRLIPSATFAAKRDDGNSVFFDGHLSPVTVISYVGQDLVSGDSLGNIIVWNMKTNSPTRNLKVHNGAVIALQFDATRIVSGGGDGKVNVTDILTGQVLQKLDGHTDRILDIQFDRHMILSLSADGTLRHWIWQTKDDGSGGSIWHLLAPGESVKAVSLLYHVTTREILLWNNIRDVQKLYTGQRLLIRPSQSVIQKPVENEDDVISSAYGKLSLEREIANMEFSSKHKTREEQLEQKKKEREIAKAYFPKIKIKKKKKKEEEEEGSEEESSSGEEDSEDESSEAESSSQDDQSGDENSDEDDENVEEEK